MRVRDRGGYLERALARRASESHPHVGDIRGRGLFRGTRTGRRPRDARSLSIPRCDLHARVKSEAMRAGLCVYPMGGTIDGVRGDHVLLAPPYIIRESEIDEVVARLARAIDAAVAAARRDGAPRSLSMTGPTQEES